MRDFIVLLIVFGAIPMVLMRPYVGVMVWSWISYMNPHQFGWGFAIAFPFAMVAGVTTMVAMLFSSEPKRIPWTTLTFFWLLWVAWMNVTMLYALEPVDAMIEWDRAMKIQLFTLITMILINDRHKINMLVWTIVISLGFYGVKGGIFSISTGGQYLVLGPPNSFFAENNTLALTLIMTLPLMWYLISQAANKWVRWGMMVSVALTALAILTSHSRGALLAGGAMVFVLWLKSRHKAWTGIALVVALLVMVPFMPDHWFERMGTIQTFEQDESAMGRINAWWFAYNIASEYPITGGGFRAFSARLFKIYAPDPNNFVDAHSIYFEVLGEQGFVGLVLFLIVGVLALLTGGWVVRHTKKIPELRWARDLAAMLQVSLIGYATGGLFLGLAYFDLYYHLIALVCILKYLVKRELRDRAAESETEAHAAFPSVQANSVPPDDTVTDQKSNPSPS